ncbi:aldehyde dehydrogenase family protein [Rhodococcus sp. C26F]
MLSILSTSFVAVLTELLIIDPRMHKITFTVLTGSARIRSASPPIGCCAPRWSLPATPCSGVRRRRHRRSRRGAGSFYRPTVLDQAPTVKEEIFGPVAAVTVFDTEFVDECRRVL